MPTIAERIPGFPLEALTTDIKPLHAIPGNAITYPEHAAHSDSLKPKTVAEEHAQSWNGKDNPEVAAEVLSPRTVIRVNKITLTTRNYDNAMTVGVVKDGVDAPRTGLKVPMPVTTSRVGEPDNEPLSMSPAATLRERLGDGPIRW